MPLQLLLEVTVSPHLQVDTERGILRRVKVLGRQSANGRVYSSEAVRNARSMYEGAVVNFDHPHRTTPTAERSVQDRAGWIENVSVDQDGGLTGDLHLLKSDDRSAKVIEAAERRPVLFGLSHNAEGQLSRQGDQIIVEKIEKLRSVDIVSDPATTRSLFESQDQEKTVMSEDIVPATAVAADAAFTELPDVQPVEAVKKSFKEAVVAVLGEDDLDATGKLEKIKALLAAEEEAVASLTNGNSPAEPSAASAASDSTTESRLSVLEQRLAFIETKPLLAQLLETAGIVPLPVRIRSLARCQSAEERKALLGTWPQDATSHRFSSLSARMPQQEKPRGGSVLTEGTSPGGAMMGAKEFATLITN